MEKKYERYTYDESELKALNDMAKILAAENITIITDPRAPTASFNLKARILRLPTWSDLDKDIADWMRAHEVAHARWTPPEGYHQNIMDSIERLVGQRKYPALMADVFNILEDIRIERKMKALLPVMNRVFPIAAKKVMETYWMNVPIETYFKDCWSDAKSSDRINIVAKLDQYSDRLTDKERKIYASAMVAEEFEDLKEIAMELYELVLSQTAQKKNKPEKNEGGSNTVPNFVLEELSDLDEEEYIPLFESEDDGESDEGIVTDSESEESDEGAADGKSEEAESEAASGESEEAESEAASGESEEAESEAASGESEEDDIPSGQGDLDSGTDSDEEIDRETEGSANSSDNIEDDVDLDESELLSESRDAFEKLERREEVEHTNQVLVVPGELRILASEAHMGSAMARLDRY